MHIEAEYWKQICGKQTLNDCRELQNRLAQQKLQNYLLMMGKILQKNFLGGDSGVSGRLHRKSNLDLVGYMCIKR